MKKRTRIKDFLTKDDCKLILKAIDFFDDVIGSEYVKTYRDDLKQTEALKRSKSVRDKLIQEFEIPPTATGDDQ